MSFQNAKIIGKDVNPEEYHAQKGERGTLDFAASSSSLRLFNECPSKFIHGFEPPPSASLEYGSLLDAVVLAPEQFKDRYAVQPATYECWAMKCPSCGQIKASKKCKACGCEREEVMVTKKWNNGATFCEEWTKARLAEGKAICTASELADAEAAKKRLMEDPIIGDYIRESDKQVWIAAEWHDEPTGLVIPVKCLVDLLPRFDSEFFEGAGDLKSTKCAKQASWERFAGAVGYDIQGAWNIDLVQAALPNERRYKFSFILSESNAPWEPSREEMELSGDMDQTGSLMADARARYRRMMGAYCQCLKRNKWPGYADTDESKLSGGWNVWRQDPYKAQREMFAPRFDTGEITEGNEGNEAEPVEGLYRH